MLWLISGVWTGSWKIIKLPDQFTTGLACFFMAFVTLYFYGNSYSAMLFAEECEKDRARVLVHCMSGKNRWIGLAQWFLASTL